MGGQQMMHGGGQNFGGQGQWNQGGGGYQGHHQGNRDYNNQGGGRRPYNNNGGGYQGQQNRGGGRGRGGGFGSSPFKPAHAMNPRGPINLITNNFKIKSQTNHSGIIYTYTVDFIDGENMEQLHHSAAA